MDTVEMTGSPRFVTYRGRLCRVESVNVSGVAAPYYRLTDYETMEYLGLTSHRLCGPAEQIDQSATERGQDSTATTHYRVVLEANDLSRTTIGSFETYDRAHNCARVLGDGMFDTLRNRPGGKRARMEVKPNQVSMWDGRRWVCTYHVEPAETEASV